jgi:hypothetical protein
MIVTTQMALASKVSKEVDDHKKVERSRVPNMVALTLIGPVVENDHNY